MKAKSAAAKLRATKKQPKPKEMSLEEVESIFVEKLQEKYKLTGLRRSHRLPPPSPVHIYICLVLI
jgi:hypothetical protein